MIMLLSHVFLGGAQHNTGIFIHKITPNSKAEELGLQVNLYYNEVSDYHYGFDI